jgi:hypothetical protein
MGDLMEMLFFKFFVTLGKTATKSYEGAKTAFMVEILSCKNVLMFCCV